MRWKTSDRNLVRAKQKFTQRFRLSGALIKWAEYEITWRKRFASQTKFNLCEIWMKPALEKMSVFDFELNCSGGQNKFQLSKCPLFRARIFVCALIFVCEQSKSCSCFKSSEHFALFVLVFFRFDLSLGNRLACLSTSAPVLRWKELRKKVIRRKDLHRKWNLICAIFN